MKGAPDKGIRCTPEADLSSCGTGSQQPYGTFVLQKHVYASVAIRRVLPSQNNASLA